MDLNQGAGMVMDASESHVDADVFKPDGIATTAHRRTNVFFVELSPAHGHRIDRACPANTQLALLEERNVQLSTLLDGPGQPRDAIGKTTLPALRQLP